MFRRQPRLLQQPLRLPIAAIAATEGPILTVATVVGIRIRKAIEIVQCRLSKRWERADVNRDRSGRASRRSIRASTTKSIQARSEDGASHREKLQPHLAAMRSATSAMAVRMLSASGAAAGVVRDPECSPDASGATKNH